MPPLQTIDRYRILGEIGRGAMGTVYRAHDPRLDREVAVKTISGVVEEGTQGDELTIRFEREARVAARLRHPNVVAVHDAGRDGDRLFLVLELVEGESLAARIGRGDFPARADSLEMMAQAADALAAAHAAGIVHRDIKPGNLLLTRDGRILVTDFGIAKALGETSELTRTGMVVGSPAYLSPEQVQGMPLDGRSDLFSLGVVLFELLLRRKPFAAETFTSLVYQILTADPLASGADLDTLPPALADLLRQTLAKDREHRLPDARLFAMRAREIARALPEQSSVSEPTMVLAASGAARPAAAFPPPPPPPMPVVPAARTAPTGLSAAPVPVAPPAATAVGSGVRSAPSPWLGFALGAVAAVAIVGAVILVAGARERPAPPATGAPPAVALVDSARPLTQPEPPPATTSAPPVAATTEPPPAEPKPAPAAPATSAAAPASAPATSAAAPASAPAPQPSATAPAAPPAAPRPSVAATPAAAAPYPGVPAPATAPPAAAATEPAAESEPAPAAPPAVSPPISESYETRSAAEFHVSPEEATVTINGARIGIADDWDGAGGGKEYVFPAPGVYIVRLDADGYQTAWVRIVVRPQAKKKSVDVDTDLEEIE